jgi:hypothetical protein
MITHIAEAPILNDGRNKKINHSIVKSIPDNYPYQ